jgi:hypothetical protein
VRVLQLAEDLGLAEHRGLESGRRAQQMACRVRAMADLHDGRELVERTAHAARESRQQHALEPVGIRTHDVGLHARARGEHEGLASRRKGSEPRGHGAYRVAADGQALAPRQRRRRVGDADLDDLAHVATVPGAVAPLTAGCWSWSGRWAARTARGARSAASSW